MSTRDDPVHRATRRMRRQIIDVLHDLREARLSGGLSQGVVATRVGISRQRLGRIEAGAEPRVPAELLGQLSAVVGLELSLRAFAGGEPIRDVAQVATMGRLRARLGHRWMWHTEVVVPLPGDQRAWDAVGIHQDTRLTIWVEVESRVRDSQALLRRIELKRRDSTAIRVILVLSATHSNRQVVRHTSASFEEAFPVSSRRALASLERGLDPGGDALVFL